ncbi:amino acid ABC transporter permease [Chelatococcus asaccharovorans]|uniref:Amino acid ABC transporter membrane protein 1 (PAAT family) n=1 Tax=Chelatococcus asaccharovorans TaxID=28210 RepID=A0A2V3UI82_9HYPH|nr:amino acid ABC transporter permease [Chelatococcus asaccharovorans]MBS7706289.1 amino acid ABC transporter permease [Chelatococcus asaccharovorans]PXW65072.1 amino acid ABC transporter membrane protein 1 (PAAT family) [Chelatococcus asaccharovorans]
MFDYTFLWPLVWAEWPQLLAGARVTLEITILSMAVATVAAFPLALARRAGKGLSCQAATIWVEAARNTPCLVQIYMVYFGLGALGLHIGSYFAVLGAITFNNTGYLAEMFRGGLNAVAPQQFNAGRSLGLTAFQTYKNIIFPQVFRIVYFPFVNQITWAMLNSSLGMIIGLRELTGATQMAQSVSFRTFEFFVVAAGLYYAIAKSVQILARVVAWRAFRRA